MSHDSDPFNSDKVLDDAFKRLDETMAASHKLIDESFTKLAKILDGVPPLRAESSSDRVLADLGQGVKLATVGGHQVFRIGYLDIIVDRLTWQQCEVMCHWLYERSLQGPSHG